MAFKLLAAWSPCAQRGAPWLSVETAQPGAQPPSGPTPQSSSRARGGCPWASIAVLIDVRRWPSWRTWTNRKDDSGIWRHIKDPLPKTVQLGQRNSGLWCVFVVVLVLGFGWVVYFRASLRYKDVLIRLVIWSLMHFKYLFTIYLEERLLSEKGKKKKKGSPLSPFSLAVNSSALVPNVHSPLNSWNVLREVGFPQKDIQQTLQFLELDFYDLTAYSRSLSK